MKPSIRTTPKCVLCENPGTFTPMFSELQPDLCAEHYDYAMNYQAKRPTEKS